MKVAILGSGFGLYGYLPALAHNSIQNVLLPERYREHLQSRGDVKRFSDLIEWHDNEEAILNECDAVLIAKRPCDQVYWVGECLLRNNIQRILLEKPLAPNPQQAKNLVKSLDQSGKMFRVGYNFRFTPWGLVLRDWIRNGNANELSTITINWQFRAYHYIHDLNNWKRFESTGGGALRFFGIHLLGFLAEMGFSEVQSSKISHEVKDEAKQWLAVIAGGGLPNCHIFVDSNSSTNCFSIAGRDAAGARTISIELRDPFDSDSLESDTAGLDRRVPILTRLCQDCLHSSDASYPWYRGSVELWHKVELLTEYVHVAS